MAFSITRGWLDFWDTYLPAMSDFFVGQNISTTSFGPEMLLTVEVMKAKGCDALQEGWLTLKEATRSAFRGETKRRFFEQQVFHRLVKPRLNCPTPRRTPNFNWRSPPRRDGVKATLLYSDPLPGFAPRAAVA